MVKEAKGISNSPSAVSFGELLFRRSYITGSIAAESLNISPPTANNLIDAYIDAGYLVQVNKARRNRVFAFKPYLDVLHECAEYLSEVLGETDHLATNSQLDSPT